MNPIYLRACALGLLGIGWPAGASAACVSPDPYDCLIAYFGDVHNHPANIEMWRTMDDPEHDPALGCVHSYRLTSTLCSQARENGADWINVSHHTAQLASGTDAGYAWFTATNTPFLEPDAGSTADAIPRDTAGFLLTDGVTYSSRELEWSCDQAATESTPDFLCLCGLEYTVASGGRHGCPLEQRGIRLCGGHKILACPEVPDGNCGHKVETGGLEFDVCPDEAAVYAFAERNGCAVIMAHPCGAQPADFTRFDGAHPGGLHPYYAVGMEMSGRSATCETGGQLVDGVPTRSYQYQLDARGYRLAPVSGLDTHMKPAGGDGSAATLGREDCSQADSQPFDGQHTGCWMNELTRLELIAALRARRCFWNAGGRATITLSMGDDDDGTRRVPMGGLLQVDDADAHVVVTALEDPGAGASFDRIEVVKAGAVVLGCAYPCAIDAVVSAAEAGGSLEGSWYARAVRGTDTKLVSAPIWIDVLP